VLPLTQRRQSAPPLFRSFEAVFRTVPIRLPTSLLLAMSSRSPCVCLSVGYGPVPSSLGFFLYFFCFFFCCVFRGLWCYVEVMHAFPRPSCMLILRVIGQTRARYKGIRTAFPPFNVGGRAQVYSSFSYPVISCLLSDMVNTASD